METPQPGSVEILAGRSTRWHFAAEKLHKTRQPRETGDYAAEPTAVVKSFSLDELASL